MSFNQKKREQIQHYILEKIDEGRDQIAKAAAEAFGISLNTVYRYIRDLEKSNIIKKDGRALRLVETAHAMVFARSEEAPMNEDRVYREYIAAYLCHFPDNIQRIWQYSFMEMMNNAIEHSMAEKIKVSVFQNYMTTTIMIQDDGIGIFRKIKEFFHYESLDDAVTELFKGKLTTDSSRHSGEGIFFTSRVLDNFAALSDGKIFTQDNYSEMLQNLTDIEFLKNWKDRKGTIIYMELSNFSRKTLKETFDRFSDDDYKFVRTRIPIKNLFDTFPVARSQAKRLCNRFDQFQEIELDFDGIDEIGQAFAHEIFVVFQNAHKDIRLIPIHVCPDVEKMIRHVTGTAGISR